MKTIAPLKRKEVIWKSNWTYEEPYSIYPNDGNIANEMITS
ncbi:hypothetical protein [Radiobacillus kanasensis]|nr:hypothetical protein [Radiobacillus kanasensis]